MCPCREIELSWGAAALEPSLGRAMEAEQWPCALGGLCRLLGAGGALHFCRNGMHHAGRAWQRCCQPQTLPLRAGARAALGHAGCAVLVAAALQNVVRAF